MRLFGGIRDRVGKAWYEAKLASGLIALGHPPEKVIRESIERAFDKGGADPDGK